MIWKVHDPPPGTTPPVKVTAPDVLVTEPPEQEVELAGVAARTIPAPGVTGKVSVTEVTEIGPTFGLLIVTVSVAVPPDTIDAGAKALLIVGADAVTVSVAVFETALAGASFVVSTDVVFGCMPATLLTTTTVTVQLAAAGIVSPVSERLV